MWTSEKRRTRELEKRNERLYYKFVYEYTKCLHPDVYTQATNKYRNIRELYPKQVKDLTKTVEFMAAAKPQEPIPRYYYHRKTVNPHSDTSDTREMVLEIPLMAPSELPPFQTPQPSQTPPSPTAPVTEPCPTTHVSQPPLLLEQRVFDELLKEIQSDPDLNNILNDFPLDFPPDAGTPDTDLNQIDDVMGLTPLKEIQSDPDLNNILSDFPLDFPPDAGTPDTDLNQIDDDYTPVVWNNNDAMGLTPLEQELCLYGTTMM